jgi:hypothetical protein
MDDHLGTVEPHGCDLFNTLRIQLPWVQLHFAFAVPPFGIHTDVYVEKIDEFLRLQAAVFSV